MKNLNTKFTACANAQKKDLVENKKKENRQTITLYQSKK
jgi:hypothetical protein